MVKQKSLEQFHDDAAIQFQQPVYDRRRSPSSLSIQMHPSTSSSLDPPISPPISPEIQSTYLDDKGGEKIDGPLLSTFVTQELERKLSGRRATNKSSPIWIYFCFILIFLWLLTFVGRELSTELGSDHCVVTALNNTVEHLRNIII